MKKIFKKPVNNKFTQQKLPAWTPILSPAWVIAAFIFIFVIFLPIGVFLMIATNSVIEVEYDYTESCNMTSLNPRFGPTCTTTINVTIPTRMEPPIYLYYKLDNFYQNHRRYATSRDDYQILGQNRTYDQIKSNCYPIVQYSPNQDVETPRKNALLYNPCGLIAWSMFNDTFVVRDSSTVICNGPSPDENKCSKKNIAWPSDINYKFKGADPSTYTYPNSYFNEDGHIIPQTNDTDLMVWMRTAALPSFRKLHRIISQPINPGVIFIDIKQNYPVLQFNGRKKVILSTASWFGGKNLFLAICYLTVAGLSAVLVVIFIIAAVIFGRFNSSAKKKTSLN